MIFLKKIFLSPLIVVFILGKRLSQYLFSRGTWKSVEFELPIISINTFMKEPAPLEVLLVLKRMIANTGLSSAMIIDRGQKINAKLSIKNKGEHAYLKSFEENLPNVYMASHPILGVSELISLDENLNCILLGNEKFTGQFRSQGRIVIVNYQKPFYKEEYWPVGGVTELKSNINLADLVIFYNVPEMDSKDGLRQEFNEKLGVKTQIGLIFDGESPLLSGFLEHNREDQIINIEDHDTFEKSLVKIIKKVN